MTKLETLQLKLTATRVRMGVIEATHGAGCGHPGGSLSAADVLTYLYSVSYTHLTLPTKRIV